MSNTCRYAQICKRYYKTDGCDGQNSHECPIAWKIEDILMDDPGPSHQDEDEIPFAEEYDGPEEEEEC